MAETLRTGSGQDTTEQEIRYARLVSDFGEWELPAAQRGDTRPRAMRGDHERSTGYRGRVELGFDPGDRNKLVIADANLEVGQTISVDPVVAHALFEGMKPDESGPGRFSYDKLAEAASRGDAVTTAANQLEISDNDLVMYAGYDDLVVLGTGERGPILGFTRTDWDQFESGVRDPQATLSEFVWWADNEAANMAMAEPASAQA